MCAPNTADARGDQVEQQSADRRLAGQTLERREGNGMMRDNQIGAGGDRLGGHSRASPSGRSSASAICAIAAADQQANVVPILCQAEGGQSFKKRRNLIYVGHVLSTGFDMMEL